MEESGSIEIPKTVINGNIFLGKIKMSAEIEHIRSEAEDNYLAKDSLEVDRRD